MNAERDARDALGGPLYPDVPVFGHEITRPADSLGFGRGQIIVDRGDGILIGGSEPRTDGAAIGL